MEESLSYNLIDMFIHDVFWFAFIYIYQIKNLEDGTQ